MTRGRERSTFVQRGRSGGGGLSLDLVLGRPHEENAGQQADEDPPHPGRHPVGRRRPEVHVQHRDRHDHRKGYQDHGEHQVFACSKHILFISYSYQLNCEESRKGTHLVKASRGRSEGIISDNTKKKNVSDSRMETLRDTC
ncbi:hypothetical protein CEXT_266941 [Caerostris extrusa]|uniref:Uncharacterized protein n=1 Tax=Caerostris extrusa TaxID=172846 RepID=A0AAV4SHF6_CAEEX|nr:hypothetical protein CEXT_266941 [Caerostris extrusa]